MAEVVHAFTDPFVVNGRSYDVQVCGRPAGHVWEGWIEFQGTAGEVLRTARETTQPNRDDVVYWATALSVTYLEGAYGRALKPPAADVTEVAAAPHFDEPARDSTRPVAPEHAVLDPFSAAARGETFLRQKLGALHAWRLRDVVRAYDLADASVDLEGRSQAELIELIVSAVRA